MGSIITQGVSSGDPAGGAGPLRCAQHAMRKNYLTYTLYVCADVLYIYTWYEVSWLLNDNSTRYRTENEKNLLRFRYSISRNFSISMYQCKIKYGRAKRWKEKRVRYDIYTLRSMNDKYRNSIHGNISIRYPTQHIFLYT